MKYLLRILLIFAVFQLNSIEIFAKTISNHTNAKESVAKIILYMEDHIQSGQTESNKQDAQYYRILLKKLNAKKYLVQDFYISGHKMTDPYVLTHGKIDYLYNETEGKEFYPREGKRVLWYESGKKLADTTYKNNHEEGTWITWYENGTKKLEETYSIGKLTGVQRRWHDNGIKSNETYYLDGKQQGTSREWDKDGRLQGECNFIKGIMNGRCYSKFDAQKNIYHYDGYYKNGEKSGIWRTWDRQGVLRSEEKY